MTEKPAPEVQPSDEALRIIDQFRQKDEFNGNNSNTYSVIRTLHGEEVVVKYKASGEEVHIPVTKKSD